MQRRQFLAAATILIPGVWTVAESKENTMSKALKPKSEWKALLPPASFKVLF